MWKPHETSTQHLQRSKQKVVFSGQTQAARPGHGHPQAACWDLPTVVTAIPEFLLQEWNLFRYLGSTPEISRPILELPKIHKSQIQLDENEDLSHFLGRFFF